MNKNQLIQFFQEKPRTTASKANVRFGLSLERNDNFGVFLETSAEIYNVYNALQNLDQVHMMECPNNVSHAGLFVDLDAKVNDTVSIFTNYSIKKLLEILFNIISQHCQKRVQKIEEFFAFIFHRSVTGPKDGLHILIPEIQLSGSERSYILNKLKETIGPAFPMQENPENMVDLQVSHNNLHVYKSHKPNGVPYVFSYIYIAQFIDSKFYQLSECPYSKEFMSGKINGNKINLGYELSLVFNLGPSEINANLRAIELSNGQRAYIFLSKRQFSIPEAPKENKIMVDLTGDKKEEMMLVLNNLPDDYYNEYSKWIRVLISIINEFKENRIIYDEMQDLCHSFSKKSPKYDKETVNLKIKNLLKSNSSSLRLHFQSFENIVNSICPDILTKKYDSILFRHMSEHNKLEPIDIANYFYDIFKENYFTENGTWYEYRIPGMTWTNHNPVLYHWVQYSKEVDPPFLQQYYQSSEFKRQVSRVNRLLENKKVINTRFSFMNEVLRFLFIKFQTEDRAKKLDTVPWVIGTLDGIVDIRENMFLTFGPDLMVQKYVPWNYVPYEKNKWTEDIKNVYKEIFAKEENNDNETWKFVLYFLSTWLIGVPQRLMLYLHGSGRNAKTAAVQLAISALGPYASVLDMGLLTGINRTDAGQANSAKMKLKGLRGGYFDESESGSKLNASTFKALVNTASAMITTRELHQKQETFELMVNLALLSNFPISMDSEDSAIWDRLLYCKCPMRFLSNFEQGDKFVKKERPEIKQWGKDQQYMEAMLSVLVHYGHKLFHKYAGNIYNVPHLRIKMETDKLRTELDPVYRFFVENFIEDPMSSISLSDFRLLYIKSGGKKGTELGQQHPIIKKYIDRNENLVGIKLFTK